MNSERKNYPMKEFQAIFSISSILVIRSGYAKKDHISILAVIQKIWDLHKFGLQIWIQNAKITLWKNFGQFFRFHQFWSSGPCMRIIIINKRIYQPFEFCWTLSVLEKKKKKKKNSFLLSLLGRDFKIKCYGMRWKMDEL